MNGILDEMDNATVISESFRLGRIDKWGRRSRCGLYDQPIREDDVLCPDILPDVTVLIQGEFLSEYSISAKEVRETHIWQVAAIPNGTVAKGES